MAGRKFLTKSIFKVGLECPKKLYYHNKPDEYLNGKVEDPFLAALARGGYQVGALATLKYQSGIEIKTHNHEQAIGETAEHFQKPHSILFEAAFSADSFYVRSDIAIKSGDRLRIIEVKSKSSNSDEDEGEGDFVSPRDSKPGQPKLYSKWIPYIYDLAFQVHVARLNYPNLKVSASLLLLDKATVCSEDGLHQMFLIKQSGKYKEVVLTKKPDADFKGHEILREFDLTELVDNIINGCETSDFHIQGTMAERASRLAEIFLKHQKYPVNEAIGTHCKKCEFRGTDEKLKSGFDECWLEYANIEAASSKVMSFDLWMGSKKALENRKYLLKDLTDTDLGKPGHTVDRQLLQIQLHNSTEKAPAIDIQGLRDDMANWKWPLHFIDFETCTPALPFLKGFAPYSEVAFQFSHHTMQEDGSIKHAGEFIDIRPGVFPTFDFLRSLKKQLELDNGTILRYSTHENSVLNRAIFLLERSKENDKRELITFFKTITRKKGLKKKDDDLWKGDRNMVDLLEVVKRNYLSPLMGGSNSLKYVLPAILNESDFLKKKYSEPVYGTSAIYSSNFKNKPWIKKVGGGYTSDPYKELDPLFTEEEMLRIDDIFAEENEINNGGAAMMAYSYSQFTEMTDDRRAAIRVALLKYCELDTLAMVMLVEYWRDVLKTS